MLIAVRQFVQSILVIIVLAAFLQIILPSGRMRRYAQLALALVMILTLLQPIVALTQSSWDLNELLGQAQIATSWAELRAGSELLQRQNDAALVQVYRSILYQQVQDITRREGELELEACEVELVEDREADDYGRIIRLHLVCRRTPNAVKPVASIQSVDVGHKTPGAQPAETAWAEAKQASIRLAIARHFSLATEQVLVTIKGEG
ncbi:MAG: stage III sporulation protein AF [Firmicutes bacterium]|nr:stage III sporulation protein AF [Bacillota bacterium]